MPASFEGELVSHLPPVSAAAGDRLTRVLGRLGPALENRNFALLWVALVFMGLGAQMPAVAIGWQVYELHHSALDLGWIGLAEFVPMILLALPAGQLADAFRAGSCSAARSCSRSSRRA